MPRKNNQQAQGTKKKDRAWDAQNFIRGLD